jgi:hypothetical protein
MRAISLVCVTALLVGGCATWSTATMEESKSGTTARAAKAPSQVLVTEGDITDRPYIVIGDVSVTVNKTTIFHPDPTRDMVNAALQKEAAERGADAVVLTRYGTVGISLMSWGSLEGKGRAVAFK